MIFIFWFNCFFLVLALSTSDLSTVLAQNTLSTVLVHVLESTSAI